MLSDYRDAVDSYFSCDAAQVSGTERDNAIVRAIAAYADDFPRQVVEDVTATAADELPVPAAWESGFSVLLWAEYPVGNKPPQMLELDYLYEYKAPGVAPVLNHVSSHFTSGENVRLTYHARHVLTADSDTIPLAHRNAVILLAVCQLCLMLAARFSADSNSTIGADSVQQQTKAQNYAGRAKQFCAQARSELGLSASGGANSVGAAMGMTDWDMFSQRGRDRLYHSRRWR